MAENNILRNQFLRNLLILSVIIVIALILYHAFFITPSLSKLLINATETDAVRITRHLASLMLTSEKNEIGKDSLNLRVSPKIEKIKEDAELMNLKVFSASGEIVLSADPAEIGEINRKRYFHDIVAKGKVYSKVVPKDRESLEGRKVTSDVLETYVPVMDGGRFLGAFEIYYDITERRKQLDKLILQSSTLTLLLASGFLIAFIFVLVQENIAMKKRRQFEEERLQKAKLHGVIEMAGAACHELNQPLQTLAAYAHSLLRDVSEDSPVVEKIKKIKETVHQVGQITKKIMNITKYETKEYINGFKIIDIDKASSSEITQGKKTPETGSGRGRG